MTAPNFPLAALVGTPEEQRAAALAAESELIMAGVPSLPTGDEHTLPRGTNLAGGDNGEIEGVAPAHTVDSTKSPYDNLETMPVSHPWSPNMSKPKPVTAEEAQAKATVLADYSSISPAQRASF